MRFAHELVYPADAENVYAMLGEREFREQVCRAQGATDWEIRVDSTGSGLDVVVEQRRPTHGVPSIAAKFVGEEIRIRTSESWTGPRAARLEVSVPGRPGRLDGDIRLSGVDGRTVQAVTGEITVAIPLLGSRLEQLIAGVLIDALDVEQGVGRAWLAR
ncbi:MAG TPA: DUF2505 domain-containing protein [Nocardioidaceae bacterium]|nr:DUF2505 domain-containing protein [Nocardioidaceae bacterium]